MAAKAQHRGLEAGGHELSLGPRFFKPTLSSIAQQTDKGAERVMREHPRKMQDMVPRSTSISLRAQHTFSAVHAFPLKKDHPLSRRHYSLPVSPAEVPNNLRPPILTVVLALGALLEGRQAREKRKETHSVHK